MKNRRVLVTGGTSGLGYELVKVFIENDWSVATFGRRSDIISGMKKSFKGKPFIAEPGDITLSNHMDYFLDEVWKEFHGVDLLILNAGALGPTPMKPFRELSLDAFRSVYETNVFGNISLMMKLLKRSGDEELKIVHVTSDAGSTPYENWSPYGTSKAAMDFLMKIVNLEGMKGRISAFSFDPGDMNTEMHRKALPDDLPENLKNPHKSALELFNIVDGMKKQ